MERLAAHNSKNVATYGWEDWTLEIEYKGKRGPSVYDYLRVPQEKWIGLLHAASATAYINAEIKPFYRAVKVS